MRALAARSATRTAADVAAAGFAITMLLQPLLAAGVLPSTMAWGGTQPVLTVSLGIASLVAVVLGAFAMTEVKG